MRPARSRAQVAIHVEGDRLIAVAGSVSGSRLEVKAWAVVARPKEVDQNDPGAVGRWVGGELKRAGMWRAARGGGVIFGVPRGEVVLKRMSFPRASAAELPGMVRLQMVRQLTVAPENAAVDFVVAVPAPGDRVGVGGAGGGTGGGEAGGPTVVLAAALQEDRLAWRRAVARGAGVSLARVGLTSAGAAALIAEASVRRTGALLGVSLGCGSAEFVVVEDGHLVFARATDLVRPEGDADIAGFAQKVAVEAKRTWMSYRVTRESAEIDGVVVLGADEAGGAVAARCGEALELTSEAADFPAFVGAPAGMTARERSSVAPLVGMLAEPVIGRPTLDFAHPRRAPDLGAARRRRVLAGVLGAIVVGGSAFTAARLSLGAREEELAALKEEWGEQTGVYYGYVREAARAEHLERWAGARVDWLGHLDVLNGQLPEPGSAVVQRIGGRAGAEVGFELPRGAKSYSDGAWSDRVRAEFSLTGRVARRDTADALRSRFVADARYRVESRGPDLPDRFDLTLTTDVPSPVAAVPGEAKGGGP